MGATKRKAASKDSGKTKSAGRRRRRATKSAAPKIVLEGRATEDLKHELVEASDSLIVNLTKVLDALEEGADVIVTDEFHQQTKYLCDLDTWSTNLKKKLRDLYVALREKGVTFENGRFAPQFKDTSRRSVKWQEEAIRLARKLAALEDEDFDEKTFVAKTQAGYPASKSTSLSFAELG